MPYQSQKIISSVTGKIKDFVIAKYPENDWSGFDFNLETPPNSEMGDFAFPCFELAKKLKKDPKNLADELTRELKLKNVKKIISSGPYVNFFLNKKEFAQAVIADVFRKRENYGRVEKKGQRVMIEGFGQPNTHKIIHVGHLRNIFLSEAISNLFEFNGYKVKRANYYGDVGAHVAKWIWYLVNHTDRKVPQKNIGKWLASVYAKATACLDEHPEEQEGVAEVLQKLESKDKKLLKIWKKTKKLSFDEFHRVYKLLNIKFDVEFFESEVEKSGKEIVQDLLKKGIAIKSEGAIIVDLEKYGLNVFLILKSDGISLYSTKDLALAKIKFDKYKINRSIYVVDVRQSLYLKQLFKTLELMGFEQAKQCFHLSYGFVTVEGAKMASRTGEVVAAEELYKTTKERVLQEIEKREIVSTLRRAQGKREKDEIANKITLATLKFGMLKFSPEVNIDFNWEQALQFEGDTGPYIQYAYARIQSIKKKVKYVRLVRYVRKIDFSLLKTDEEWELIKLIYGFIDVAGDALENYNPALLATYLLKLAAGFNKFYQKYSVISAETEDLKKARLCLIETVEIVLKTGLKLLGIDVSDKM